MKLMHYSPWRGDTTGPSRARGTLPHKKRGQTTVLIAFAMVALVALVGLAVDGGSTYAQRRNAQNSADAVAIAAGRQMLTSYEAMLLDHPNGDVNGSVADEQTMSSTITTLALAHGIS